MSDPGGWLDDILHEADAALLRHLRDALDSGSTLAQVLRGAALDGGSCD